MLKPHLCLGLGLGLATCLLGASAHAKPEPARGRVEAMRMVPSAPSPTPIETPKRAPTALATEKRERAATEPGPSTSQPSERAGAAKARARDKEREPPPCLNSPVRLTRQLGSEIEQRELSLTFCDGKVNPGALDSLSVLARSRSVERPELAAIKAYQRLPGDEGPKDKRRDPAYVTPQIMRLHPGLLERLQRVAEHFPQRTIEVVSGHRPEARDSSRHHHGRALDFRVAGISRERLRDFLRSFEQTGVGYYPNSSFVHVDVRDDKGYWVDRSGPGEPADYGVWPPPKREIERTQARILESALAELSVLGGASLLPAPRPPPRRIDGSGVRHAAAAFAAASQPAPRAHADEAEPSESGDRLTQREIAKIRAEALKALAALQN
jgi:hypothetical protein